MADDPTGHAVETLAGWLVSDAVLYGSSATAYSVWPRLPKDVLDRIDSRVSQIGRVYQPPPATRMAAVEHLTPKAQTAELPCPGYEGSVGPSAAQFGRPHVYARDPKSGAGNCICGRGPMHRIHPEVAPGVPNLVVTEVPNDA